MQVNTKEILLNHPSKGLAHCALLPSHAMLQAETNTDFRDLNGQMENMTWQLWNILHCIKLTLKLNETSVQ